MTRATTPETTAPTTTAPTRQATPNRQLPPKAYKGAGGPVPASAIKLDIQPQEYGDAYAAFTTPSGNIGCEIIADRLGCGIESWMKEEKYGNGEHGDFSESPPFMMVIYRGAVIPKPQGRTDAPYWGDPNIGVLEYGTVGYALGHACASEKTGITCWNVKTGHGFWAAREGYATF